MPQGALRLPTSVKTCRELLRGILEFVHLQGPWAAHIIEGREGEQKLLHPNSMGMYRHHYGHERRLSFKTAS